MCELNIIMGNSFTGAGIALILNCIAFGILFGSWKGLITKRKSLTWSAWGVHALALYFWSITFNPEFGIPLGLMVPSIIAWFIVLFNTKSQERSNSRNKNKTVKKEGEFIESSLGVRALKSIKPVFRNLLLFILVVPFSGIISTLITVFISRLLPWNDLNQMVFSAFFMPFAWGCSSYWISADSKLLRPFIILSLSGIVSALLLFYSNL